MSIYEKTRLHQPVEVVVLPPPHPVRAKVLIFDRLFCLVKIILPPKVLSKYLMRMI